MELSLKAARPLYEAAALFKELKCWNWLSNSHIFGVQNPENGEIGYCTVLGNGGEMYGMAVYLGTEGLDTILSLLRGVPKGDPMFTQHCLMLSFDSRDELYPEEYAQIKALGLSFRGRTSWPTFRLYEPGFGPWPVWEEGQARYLIQCLEQAAAVAREVQANPDALFDGDWETFLVRIPEKAENGAWTWSNRWLAPAAESGDAAADSRSAGEGDAQGASPIDEIRTARLRKLPVKEEQEWSAGVFFLPLPIKEAGKRPVYPQMLIIMDETSGMIVHTELREKNEWLLQGAELLPELLERLGFRPGKMVFADEGMARSWHGLLEALGTEVYLAERLPLLESVIEEFVGHMG